jgi:hypothetical protein
VTLDGAELLNEVERFVSRFVAYPSAEARSAHVLWIGHTHFMERWESTPRLLAVSEEPSSGKSRLLEITEHLVPKGVIAVGPSESYLFRKIAEDVPPTLLFDEIDTVAEYLVMALPAVFRRMHRLQTPRSASLATSAGKFSKRRLMN